MTRTGRIAAAAEIGAVLVAAAPAHAQPSNTGGKLLLMHYMPWFETPDVRDKWGEHWAGFNGEADPDQVVGPDGRRDIWSNYYPLIDLYDSTDPDVLECQLLQMKLAGVDGVVADWYGLSGEVDYPQIHHATLALADAAEDFGMTFTVCFEDRTVGLLLDLGLLPPGGETLHLSNTFQWVENNWFNRPHYQRVDGRPLLLNFGPISVTDAAVWAAALGSLTEAPELFALHNLWTSINADGGFMWVHWDAWAGMPSESVIKSRLETIFWAASGDPSRVIASAVPGFDDVYPPGESFPFLDHRGGATLRESLAVSLDGPWPIVQLVTWNDYGEGTMIEPTREFGYTFLEVVQSERRRELGPAAFTYSPVDLRQPARLLAARRSSSASAAALDQASAWLAGGEPGRARSLLDVIAGVAIAADPAGAIADAGGTLVLEADLNGPGDGLELRWEKDGGPLVDGGRVSGATTTRLQIIGARDDDIGRYRLVATIAGETEASSSAVAAVRPSDLDTDVNGDGSVDQTDLSDLLSALSP